MKICCISDTHHKHLELDLPKESEVDTIIHAGDFSGSAETYYNFLSWYSNLPYKNKILIAGNHDEYIAKIGYKKVLQMCNTLGIIYLQDTSVKIDGIKFHGSPWSNMFCNWAFMTDDSKLVKYWDLIPNDTDILITHGPAYGKGDKVNNNWSSEKNAGSKTLLQKLNDLKNLKFHFYGHIHEAFGEHLDKNQKFISYNASSFDYYKKGLNRPLVFEVKNR